MSASHPMIFVSIVAYCDPMLPRTLDDCLANAQHPGNLKFGICHQFDPDEPVELLRFKNDGRFGFTDYHYRESEGGSWARSIAQQFWNGETYTLQIDSHTCFAPGWDTSLVRMMRSFPAEKPLITYIPPLFRVDSRGIFLKQTDLGIRATRMADWPEMIGWAPWFDWGQRVTRSPVHNRFLSGAFVFTLGKWTEEVRQDPWHYYHGEEFALTLRSYTHGYDLFVPDTFVAWHMLHAEAPPRRHAEHGAKVMEAKRSTAAERLRRLAYSSSADDHRGLGRYGLGRKRSLADYERFAGMDLTSKRAHPDVYEGRPPDPLTIASRGDWDNCIDFKDYAKSQHEQIEGA